MIYIVCNNCGNAISSDDVERSLWCNEEGEDWTSFEVECPFCDTVYDEASTWGEENDLETAAEIVAQHYGMEIM